VTQEKHGKEIIRQLHDLHVNGLKLDPSNPDSQKLNIELLVGGDLLFLSSEMGLAGCYAICPCPWCLVRGDSLHSTSAADCEERSITDAFEVGT
jgi:hypothetical protein